MLTKFCERICSGCGVRWKVDGNVVIEFRGAFFFNSFSQFDLHRLHNMLTEFCEPTLSHCGGRWKVSNLPTMATTTRNYVI